MMNKDINLIGCFGIGFYSSFLVADKLQILTKRFDPDEPINTPAVYKWVSNSQSFFLEKMADHTLLQDIDSGTEITLHLKEGYDEFLEEYKLKELLTKYAQFSRYPIQVFSKKIEYIRAPAVGEGHLGQSKLQTTQKQSYEWVTINCAENLLAFSAGNAPVDRYYDFYKSTFKVHEDPMAYTHFKVEGQVNFSSVLFIPEALPFELSRNMFEENFNSLLLYIKQVFINDSFSKYLPRWLKFMRGVINSETLPLNVGRNTLQTSHVVSLISERITQKALDIIKNIKIRNPDKWSRLTRAFGKYLKVGLIEDTDNQSELARLVQFYSDKSPNNLIFLDEYIDRMKKNQEAIYYLASESQNLPTNWPALEKLKDLNYEVIFCSEPIDEFALSSLAINKYRGHDIIDANKSDLKLPQTAQKDSYQLPSDGRLEQEFDSLCEWLQKLFAQKVQRVAVTSRLKTHPAVLLQGDFGVSPTMQQYMQQQASSQGSMYESLHMPEMNQSILEINPNHPICISLKKQFREGSLKDAEKTALLLFNVTAMRGGYSAINSGSFAQEIVDLLTMKATEMN